MAYKFKDIKDICDSRGIHLINFGTNQKYNVIEIIDIHFIIGDCKGNTLLCGRREMSFNGRLVLKSYHTS